MSFFKITLFLGLMLWATAGAAQTRGDERIVQIRAAIERVRVDKTVDSRADAAERLAGLTGKLNRTQVTPALVTDLISLLDSPDDSVRYWVAIALGNIGPAGKAAVPKLEEMLPKADCINGAMTSAGGIRYALIKMGIKPPAAPKCPRIAG